MRGTVSSAVAQLFLVRWCLFPNKSRPIRVTTIALKLILTPILIGSASLAGRKWGAALGGWLVGLPLTSGPIALFLALEQGTAFASRAALGILFGLV
jgi:hypothetical protein